MCLYDTRHFYIVGSEHIAEQYLTERFVACPLQLWLRERAAILLYVHCLSLFFCVKAQTRGFKMN